MCVLKHKCVFNSPGRVQLKFPKNTHINYLLL